MNLNVLNDFHGKCDLLWLLHRELHLLKLKCYQCLAQGRRQYMKVLIDIYKVSLIVSRESWCGTLVRVRRHFVNVWMDSHRVGIKSMLFWIWHFNLRAVLIVNFLNGTGPWKPNLNNQIQKLKKIFFVWNRSLSLKDPDYNGIHNITVRSRTILLIPPKIKEKKTYPLEDPECSENSQQPEDVLLFVYIYQHAILHITVSPLYL